MIFYSFDFCLPLTKPKGDMKLWGLWERLLSKVGREEDFFSYKHLKIIFLQFIENERERIAMERREEDEEERNLKVFMLLKLSMKVQRAKKSLVS